jgi:hypothetical protein
VIAEESFTGGASYASGILKAINVRSYTSRVLSLGKRNSILDEKGSEAWLKRPRFWSRWRIESTRLCATKTKKEEESRGPFLLF